MSDQSSNKRELDVDRALVTSGFIVLHTHLDAQFGWDPLLTPVSLHGVARLGRLDTSALQAKGIPDVPRPHSKSREIDAVIFATAFRLALSASLR